MDEVINAGKHAQRQAVLYMHMNHHLSITLSLVSPSVDGCGRARLP